ncbi:MAG: ABC transporter substrate-binding protein [Chloroflexi bacterium]|nr:ABC transporter substrate-binding protein [Chloroflexota bacterium]
MKNPQAFWLKLLVVLTLLSALAAACAPKAGSTTPSRTTTPQATAAPTAQPAGPSGELKVALSAMGTESFYPPAGGLSDVTTTLAPMFDWLFTLKGLDLAPGLIEKWEVAPDGLSWIYNVRRGVKFHDGKELTGADVKYSLEQYVVPAAASPFLRGMIDRVQATDNYTVRVFTKGTQPYLPHTSTLYDPSQGAVMPKDYAEQQGRANFELRPIGTGPFKFAKHTRGDAVQYEAFDQYWGQVPAFKSLTLILMPEESTRVASLKTGAVDIIDVGLDASNELEKGGFRTPTLDVALPHIRVYGAYDAQASRLPIADARVRQALSLAINRDEIRSTVFFGKADPVFVPGLPLGAADVDLNYWRDFSAKAYRYDPTAARDLLKQAGYADGFSIKMYAFAMGGAPYLPQLAQIVAGYWGAIGVKTELTPIEFSTFRTWFPSLPPKAQVLGQASVFRDTDNPVTPKPLRSAFYSTGTWALNGKATPELDKLIDSATSEPDPAKRKEMLTNAVQMAVDSWTYLPVAGAPAVSALGPKVSIDFPKPAIAIALYLNRAKHAK